MSPSPARCPAGVGAETWTCLPQVLVFLQALLASRKHKGEQEVTALLKEAAELHFSSMQGLPLGSEYFEKLDPLFLVCLAKEYLFFCPKQVSRSPSLGLDRGRDLAWLATRLLCTPVAGELLLLQTCMCSI